MKIFAYILSAPIGFAIVHYLPQSATAAFASILIPYHLYLFILVVSGRHEKGISLPVGKTIPIHLAFLVVLIGLPCMRARIPFFTPAGLLVPGLALFETMWLFSGPSRTARKIEDLKPVDTASATAEDHREFVGYLRTGRRAFRRRGATVDDEFRAWLTDRARKRPAEG